MACRVVEVPVQTAAEIRDVPRPTVPAGNRAGGSEPFVLIIVGTEEAAEAIRAQGQTGTLWRAGRGFDMDVHALPDAESEAFFWNAFAEAENLRCNTPCRDIVVLDLRAGRH